MLGLTATPIRRDGQQPIIFMQCGPIRHTAAKTCRVPRTTWQVMPAFAALHGSTCRRRRGFRMCSGTSPMIRPERPQLPPKSGRAFDQGRKVLVLTERTEHLDAIQTALGGKVPSLFVLHGRMSRKQRATLIAELDALPPDAPRVLLATGKLVGEGFDHPPLDTLVLAMPVSWKGTLQQYAGRLHREHADQDRRAHHRLRRYRPPGPAADVGQAPARLPGDGLPDRRAAARYAGHASNDPSERDLMGVHDGKKTGGKVSRDNSLWRLMPALLGRVPDRRRRAPMMSAMVIEVDRCR